MSRDAGGATVVRDKPPGMSTVRKVYAYVTRVRDGVTELLVFEHRGMPHVGLEIPGGTVEPGEDVADAALRELEEESGLTGLESLGLIDTYTWVNPNSGKLHERHVFHFLAPRDIPDAWSQRPRGENEEQKGYTFDFRWIAVAEAHTVSNEQGRSASRLK
jgi:8-oxo-dGTP pyrophosphatase MutT (NUDIX family)